MENEIWKEVIGYEGLYKVSDQGRVYSIKTNRILKGCTEKGGYIILVFRKDGKRKNHRLHRIMSEAFIPKPDGRDVVNHIDGDRANNTLSNFEWVTQGENMQHAHSNGLIPYKNRQRKIELVYPVLDRSRKITEKDVLYIRSVSKTNGGSIPNADLARHYGVSRNAISKIVNRVTWKHVD